MQRPDHHHEQGFTLIELLVVIIIIGLLAAIAIPVFLNQRRAAVDKQMTSDAMSIALEVETYLTATQDRYPLTASVVASGQIVSVDGGDPVHLSPGNVVAFNGDGTHYCLHILREAGAPEGNVTTVAISNTSGGPQEGRVCSGVTVAP